MLARDERSSLFGIFISDEDMNFNNIDLRLLFPPSFSP